MNSGRVLAGTDGFTTMMFGKRMIEAMGAMSRMKLKLSLSYNVAFHALKFPAMTSVWPSGAARTTASVPMLPPAPGLFSHLPSLQAGPHGQSEDRQGIGMDTGGRGRLG